PVHQKWPAGHRRHAADRPLRLRRLHSRGADFFDAAAGNLKRHRSIESADRLLFRAHPVIVRTYGWVSSLHYVAVTRLSEPHRRRIMAAGGEPTFGFRRTIRP